MKIQVYSVLDTTYHCHTEPDSTSIMEIRYKIGNDRTLSEYLNFETKYDSPQAAMWWQDRSPDPVPKTNQHAVDSANYHALAITQTITVEYSRLGYRIKDYAIGELPADVGEIW
jgi:hypothetical protein